MGLFDGATAREGSTADLAAALGWPVSESEDYETIAGLKGVVQLDKIDDGHALVLVQAPNGGMNLVTIDLP